MYHGDGMNTEEFARVWREYQSHGYVMDVDVLGPVLSFYHNAGLHFSAIRLFQAFPALQWEPWMYNVIARVSEIATARLHTCGAEPEFSHPPPRGGGIVILLLHCCSALSLRGTRGCCRTL